MVKLLHSANFSTPPWPYLPSTQGTGYRQVHRFHIKRIMIFVKLIMLAFSKSFYFEATNHFGVVYFEASPSDHYTQVVSISGCSWSGNFGDKRALNSGINTKADEVKKA